MALIWALVTSLLTMGLVVGIAMGLVVGIDIDHKVLSGFLVCFSSIATFGLILVAICSYEEKGKS